MTDAGVSPLALHGRGERSGVPRLAAAEALLAQGSRRFKGLGAPLGTARVDAVVVGFDEAQDRRAQRSTAAGWDVEEEEGPLVRAGRTPSDAPTEMTPIATHAVSVGGKLRVALGGQRESSSNRAHESRKWAENWVRNGQEVDNMYARVRSP